MSQNTGDWLSGWGWFIWFGVFLFAFSSVGNWGYTYRAHRKYDGDYSRKNALDLLNDRYARGEIKQEEYQRIKYDITSTDQSTHLKVAGSLI